MSKYLADKCQMREDLNGHSLIDFEMHDQTLIQKVFNQDKQDTGKIKDCLINELRNHRFFRDFKKWMKPVGHIGNDNYFSNNLLRFLQDENLKNHA